MVWLVAAMEPGAKYCCCQSGTTGAGERTIGGRGGAGGAGGVGNVGGTTGLGGVGTEQLPVGEDVMVCSWCTLFCERP